MRHDRYRPQNRKAPTEPPARRTARRRPGQCRRDRRRSEIKAFRRKTESNRFCNKDFPERKMSVRVQYATIPSLQGSEDGAGPTGAQPPAQAGTKRPFGESQGQTNGPALGQAMRPQARWCGMLHPEARCNYRTEHERELASGAQRSEPQGSIRQYVMPDNYLFLP